MEHLIISLQEEERMHTLTEAGMVSHDDTDGDGGSQRWWLRGSWGWCMAAASV